MARKIVWSFEAAAFVQETLDVSRSLNEFSERGRVVPEFGDPNIRELFIRGYRLIYSIEEYRIVLLDAVSTRCRKSQIS